MTIIVTMLFGCAEEFNAEIVDFESVLVVDAVLTNEIKQHVFLLSRTYRFREGIEMESNANIKVIEGGQTEYVFSETTPGNYVSNTSFAARPGTDYQLMITTQSGGVYFSDKVVITNETSLENLYAEITTNNSNEEGISILIDNIETETSSGYYRFEYEETYKIVAPFWNPQDLIIISDNPLTFDLVQKSQEEQICYNTDMSTKLILGNSNEFSNNRLSQYPVRFLNKEDYIISHRYSILVSQYSISREAHTFYETLNKFSGVESVFSENQPGFFNGNLNTNLNERTIGFFEVSSVSSQRIFFDYKDFYPEPVAATFPDDCRISPPIISELANALRNGRVKYFSLNENPPREEGPFFVVPRICGDCTVLGSNLVPDFWIE